jgi:hypothetical protein
VFPVGILYHVYGHVDHYIIAKMFEEEVNNILFIERKIGYKICKKMIKSI